MLDAFRKFARGVGQEHIVVVFPGHHTHPLGTGIEGDRLDGDVPEGAIVVQRTIEPNTRLDHNVGVIWNTNGTGTVRQHVFPADSAIASLYVADGAFIAFLNRMLGSRKTEVQDFFSDPDNATVNEHNFTWDIRGQVEASDTDLLLSLGTATVDGTITVRVSRQDLSLVSIRFDGTVFDVYDWDYDGGPTHDRLAATVQAGFGTLGEGGGVFYTHILLDYTSTEMQFDFRK